MCVYVEQIIERIENESYMSTKEKCVFKAVLSNEVFCDELTCRVSYQQGNVIEKYVKKTAKKMHLKLNMRESFKIKEELFYYLVLKRGGA